MENADENVKGFCLVTILKYPHSGSNYKDFGRSGCLIICNIEFNNTSVIMKGNVLDIRALHYINQVEKSAGY